ncbi:hypothetical protein [Polymorphospora lycopeni]|uniref:Uncharacterized protein n=1 Tax=Polymorphospora lycopeni TaxID=3140240 RepID=A0ABV5CVJ7_9ACTN
MKPDPIPAGEAARALQEVRHRRDQVVGTKVVPDWFWATLGVLLVAFIGSIESEIPWLVATGSVVYAVGLAALIFALLRRGGPQIRNNLIGARGGLAITGLTLGLVAVGLGVAFGVHALGVPLPGTVGAAAVALAMVIGGPLLMRYLRRVMSSRPVGGLR